MLGDDMERVLVESEHFTTDTSYLKEVEWREALQTGYRARVELEVRVEDFEPDILLGSDVRIVFGHDDAPARNLCGLISAVSEVEPLRLGMRIVLEVVPAYELLSFRRRSRIFQGKSAIEIVTEVLDAELGTYGRTFTDETNGEYKTREYCVQYDESDRDFVSRLLEEEGVWISFDHAGDIEELVLRDSNDGVPELEGAMPDKSVPYIRDASSIVRVKEARLAFTATPTKVSTLQFDWTGVTPREGEDEDADAVGPTAERYEHGHGFTLTLADYAGTAYGAHDAVQRAKVWREELGSRRIRLIGSSTVEVFNPGSAFTLSSHPVEDANQEYLLIEVTHRFSDESDRFTYENEFVAQPKARTFRPARVTPRPTVRSVETAIVVGSSGEEIETDAHGRVKVQFHWDRDGASDQNSSCFLRCAQNWAGEGWGWVFTPRMGMEVVVRFEHGDPDRPLVTGSLYTGSNTQPYTLPDEMTKSTIKSNSSLGGGGYNELRFEDKADSEEVYQQAQKDLTEKVLNNHSTHVGADQLNEVKHDQEQKIHGDQTEDVTSTQNLDVMGTRTVTVNGGFKEKVDGSQTRLISSGSTETITGGEKHKVLDSGLLELITGKETLTVTGGQTETLHSFAGQIVTGAVTETVSGSMLRQGSSLLHDASASISMTGTAGIQFKGNPTIKIKSPNYMRLAARQGDSSGNETITSAWSFEGYHTSVELVGAKAEAYSVKASVIKDKTDSSAISIGAYGVSVSLFAMKVSRKDKGKVELIALRGALNALRKKGII